MCADIEEKAKTTIPLQRLGCFLCVLHEHIADTVVSGLVHVERRSKMIER